VKIIHFHAAMIGLVSLLLAGCAGTLTPSHQDPARYTRLDAAVEKCDLDQTKALVEKDPDLVNEQGWGGTTPLQLAAMNGCTEVATYLLEMGANVNAKAEGGATSLHIAAQKGNLALVKVLLLHKADVLAVDDQGRTPEARARQWGHPDTAQFLKDYSKHR
jgi:ankyrin repeat protein